MRLARAVCGRYGLGLMTGADVSTLSVIVSGVALTKMLACSSGLQEAHVKLFESGNRSPFRIGGRSSSSTHVRNEPPRRPVLDE